MKTHNLFHPALRIGAVLGLLAGGLLTAAGPATADRSHADDAGRSRNTAHGDRLIGHKIEGPHSGFDNCADLTFGTLCLGYFGNGHFTDRYQKTGGPAINADFVLWRCNNESCSSRYAYYDQGTFTQRAGETKYYAWNNIPVPGCYQGVLQVQVGGGGTQNYVTYNNCYR